MSKTLIGFVMWVVVPSFAWGLNFNQLTQSFLENDPNIKAALQGLQSAQSDYDEAIALAMPKIDMDASYSDQKNPFGSSFPLEFSSYSSKVKVNQPLYLGGRIWNGIKVKDQAVQLNKLQFSVVVNSSLREFYKAAIRYAKFVKQKSVLSQSFRTQEGFVEITQKKYQRGNAKKFERDQAQAELLAYDSRIRQIQQQIDVAKIHLSLLSGVAVDKIEPKLDFMMPGVSLKPAEYYRSLGLKESVQIKLGEIQKHMAETQKKMIMGEHLPSLVLNGEMGWSSEKASSLFDSQNKSHSYSVLLTIPIFSGLSSVYAKQSAESKIHVAEKKLAAQQRQTIMEVSQSFLEVEAATEVFSKTKQWRVLAQSALDDGLKNFRSGIISNFQVVQLQKGQEAAESAYLDAETSLLFAWVDLTYHTGQDMKKILLTGM